MFHCKICAEKDQRIAELKEQIIYFKQVLNPPARISRYELQEDMLMDGAGKEEVNLAQTEADMIKAEQIRRETDLIFTGNDIEVEEEVG